MWRTSGDVALTAEVGAGNDSRKGWLLVGFCGRRSSLFVDPVVVGAREGMAVLNGMTHEQPKRSNMWKGDKTMGKLPH
jgi:hypothetical protein